MAVAASVVIEHVDVTFSLGPGDSTSRVDSLLEPLLFQSAPIGLGFSGILAVAVVSPPCKTL